MQQTEEKTEHAADHAQEAERKTPPLAKLRLLYESSDRRMCLFEDAEGHLVATPSSLLA